jgi:hypothetical protein
MGGRGGEKTSSGGQSEAAPLEFEWDPAKSFAVSKTRATFSGTAPQMPRAPDSR